MFTSVNRDLRNEQLSEQLVSQAYTYGADGWTFLDDEESYVVTGSVIGSYHSKSDANTHADRVRLSSRYWGKKI